MTRRINGVGYLLATAFCSGMVCYRLGSFYRCTAPWLVGLQSSQQMAPFLNASEAVVGGIDSPSFFERSHKIRPDDSPYHGNDRPTRPTSFGPDDRRSVARPSLPYDCGVVFFYHIPCTGGSSINRWLKRYQQPQFGNFSYYQHWQLESRKSGTFHPNPEKCEATFAHGMSDHIQNLGRHEWRVAHSHLVSTYLNESEELLYQWRATVEAQGCQLINTVMLRDPLNHAMSLHKIIRLKNATRQNWTKYLESPTGPGLWATVLDFFLYNNQGLRHHRDYPHGPGGRNPFNVTKETKVARALELLHRLFDVVTVSDHAAFREQILQLTGWPQTPMPHGNVFPGRLQFVKQEVEALQKLLRGNGDVEFVDRVKYEYHDYLAYLDE